MTDSSEKIVLSEDKGVFRIGNIVYRPASPWSKPKHRFNKYLFDIGLPVERILTVDNEYETSEFIDGEMVHPYKWSNEALYEVGLLTRRLHDAARKFTTNEDDVWQNWCLREIGGEDRIICHSDIAPWNMITKNGMPRTLVDWEFSGYLDTVVELARVCWLFVQLHDDDLQKLYDLPDAKTRAEQVRLICDAYGLSPSERKGFVNRIIEVIICETAHEAIDPNYTFDSVGNLWGLSWRTRSLYWVWRNRDVLENALK